MKKNPAVKRASPAAVRLIRGGEGTLNAASTNRMNAARMNSNRQENTMMDLLLDLARRCKGSVTLEINPHRNYYQSVDEYIEDLRRSSEEIKELKQRLAGAELIVHIQFYPRTPIGFYSVYGTTLEDTVKQAHEDLDEIDQADPIDS